MCCSISNVIHFEHVVNRTHKLRMIEPISRYNRPVHFDDRVFSVLVVAYNPDKQHEIVRYRTMFNHYQYPYNYIHWRRIFDHKLVGALTIPFIDFENHERQIIFGYTTNDNRALLQYESFIQWIDVWYRQNDLNYNWHTTSIEWNIWCVETRSIHRCILLVTL